MSSAPGIGGRKRFFFDFDGRFQPQAALFRLGQSEGGEFRPNERLGRPGD